MFLFLLLILDISNRCWLFRFLTFYLFRLLLLIVAYLVVIVMFVDAHHMFDKMRCDNQLVFFIELILRQLLEILTL